MGVKIIKKDDSVKIISSGNLKTAELIRTLPYPGFPTDAQSVIMSLLSVCKGEGMIEENIFDGRFKHISELRKMGADIRVEGKRAIINGVSSLNGAKVNAPDLRSGAGLVVAALCAKGITEISNVHYIERGYEDIARDLNSLGALIIKEQDL